MAATMEDGKKVDEVVSGNSEDVEEVVGEKSNADEVVGEKKSTVDKAVDDKSKMITLVSSDGESFEITHQAAALSQTIQHMIEEDCVENGVPLPNVNCNILAKVIEYCNKHAAAAAAGGTSSDTTTTATTSSGEQDLKTFDAEFIKVDQTTLFDIILAANYLDIKELLNLATQTVADIIKDKSVEEVRKYFNIENDFTPEEEAKVREENDWAFK